jgi:hypothetical protein
VRKRGGRDLRVFDRRFSFGCLLLVGLASLSYAGEPSLVEGRSVVDVGGRAVTVLGEVGNPSQFYYVPLAPRLVVTKGVPALSLLTYQLGTTAAPASGGILQFTVDYSLSASEISELAGKLGGNVKVSALPLKNARVSLFGVAAGTDFANQVFGEGVASSIETQVMAFSVRLTELGADVYERLLKSTTGIGVSIVADFEGLLPPDAVSIDIDWDKAYSLYSINSEFRARVSAPFVSVSGQASFESVKQSLAEERVIVVSYTGERVPTFVDEYIRSAIARMNEKFIDVRPRPPSVSAPEPGGGWGFQGTAALRKVEDSTRIRGREKLRFDGRTRSSRSVRMDGFVSLNSFEEKVVRGAVQSISQTTGFNVAVIGLPFECLEGAKISISRQSSVVAFMCSEGRWLTVEKKAASSYSFGMGNALAVVVGVMYSFGGVTYTRNLQVLPGSQLLDSFGDFEQFNHVYEFVPSARVARWRKCADAKISECVILKSFELSSSPVFVRKAKTVCEVGFPGRYELPEDSDVACPPGSVDRTSAE